MDLRGREFRPARGVAVGCRRCSDLEEAMSCVKQGQYIGYWKDEGGNEYIDVVDFYGSRSQAFLVALSRGQKFMYDFKDDVVINLGGMTN